MVKGYLRVREFVGQLFAHGPVANDTNPQSRNSGMQGNGQCYKKHHIFPIVQLAAPKKMIRSPVEFWYFGRGCPCRYDWSDKDTHRINSGIDKEAFALLTCANYGTALPQNKWSYDSVIKAPRKCERPTVRQKNQWNPMHECPCSGNQHGGVNAVDRDNIWPYRT